LPDKADAQCRNDCVQRPLIEVSDEQDFQTQAQGGADERRQNQSNPEASELRTAKRRGVGADSDELAMARLMTFIMPKTMARPTATSASTLMMPAAFIKIETTVCMAETDEVVTGRYDRWRFTYRLNHARILHT
jgi:hypothetical protein